MSERLGKYEVIRHLASGGMAQVYLARATGLGGFARHLVVKTIPLDRRDDETFIAMFLDEARLVGTLHHQHIAQVFDVGCADDGTYFIAMEYVHGETVRRLLETATDRGKRLPFELGLSVTCAAAAALHHAHERCDLDGTPLGIVHRDVSPSNLILGFDGSIKLIDFGIARANSRTTHTVTGFIKGKAGYMAPEQARGYIVDRRSDVFALGVLAYELTTQTRAFHAETQFETMRRTLYGELALPSQIVPDYPSSLEDVIMKALELDPEHRFQDADTMRIALEQVAGELGLTLGATPVIRALDQLFPTRPEPWLSGAELVDEEPTPVITASAPVLLVARRTPPPPRLARGTAARVSQGEPDGAEPFDPVDLTTRPFEKDLPEVPSLATIAALTASESAESLARPPSRVTRPLRVRPAATRPPPLPRPRTASASLAAAPPAFAAAAPPSTTAPPAFAAVPPPSATAPEVLGTPAWLAESPPPPNPSVPMTTSSFSAPLFSLPSTRRLATAATDRYRRALVIGASALAAVGLVAILIAIADAPSSSWQERPTVASAPRAATRSAATPNAAKTAPSTPAKTTPSTPATAAPNPAKIAPNASKPAPDGSTSTPGAATGTSVGPAPATGSADPAAAVATVLLEVTSDPVGATVVLDGVRLGTTPFSAPVPVKPGMAWLKVRLRDHAAVKTRVSLEKNVRWDVQLRPLAP